MSAEKLVGRVVIVIFTILWTGVVVNLELTRRLPHDARSGKVALVLVGFMVAWSRWRALDDEVAATAKRREQERGFAVAVDPREAFRRDGMLPNLPHGALVDLGPCPACGGGPASIIPSPPGRIEVRCRGCGLIAAPPELQPSHTGFGEDL